MEITINLIFCEQNVCFKFKKNIKQNGRTWYNGVIVVWIDVFEALAGYDTSSPAAMGLLKRENTLCPRSIVTHFK